MDSKHNDAYFSDMAAEPKVIYDASHCRVIHSRELEMFHSMRTQKVLIEKESIKDKEP